MSVDWLVGDHETVAAEHILDAAGRCFADKGVAQTSMGDVARGAGCSRQTLYRYFTDRDALRTAFVHREARRLGAAIAHKIADIHDPHERLVRAMLAALRGVRKEPTLAAWFTDGGVAATEIAARSPVLEALVAAFFGTPATKETRQVARWIVRVVLSLLVAPGGTVREERELIERFVAPAVLRDQSS
jgi:AcrR family transcriptional regulator